MGSSSWGLPEERPGSPAPDDLVARRQLAAAMAAEPPEGVTAEAVAIGGVPCVVCDPGAGATPPIIYFHGGGYRMGSAPAWTGLTGALARVCATRVVTVEYRLAPEAPFPAALVDAAAVIDAVAGHSPAGVVLAGDSAGGGLAVAAALRAPRSDVGGPSVRGLILLSPWLDLTVTAPAYESNAASDRFFSAASARDARDAYLQGQDPSDPLVSPLFGDLTALAPCLVVAGGAEVLIDDALAFTAALARAGSSVELHVAAGMGHVFPLMAPADPATAAVLGAAGRFVTRAARI